MSQDLYGPPPAGVWNPVCEVRIAGETLPPGLLPDGTLPPGRTVLDGVSITWGREDMFSQPDPATGTLTLFDASGTWATSRDLRGAAVTLYWVGPGRPATTTERRAYFRGRAAAPITVSRKTVVLPDGTKVAGSLITIPLVSILLDLANKTPRGAWPAETLGARTSRIAGMAVNAIPNGVTIREYWKAPEVAPVLLDDQVSVYDHLVSVFDSSGADRLSYLPAEERIYNVERRDFPATRGHGRLSRKLTSEAADFARAGSGVYAIGVGRVVGGYLDSVALEYPDDAGITQPELITNVALTHPDSGNAYKPRTVEVSVPDTDESRNGRRTVALTSLVAWNPYGDVAASDLAQLAGKEAAEWQLEPVTYRTAGSGGFESYLHGTVLLDGGEDLQVWFLQRSFLSHYGIRPIVGMIGQTITYRDGGWELECRLVPISTKAPQHAITWEEIDDGSAEFEVRWHDGDHERGMHESLTYEDLGWISYGLNAITIGPDTGWDVIP